MEIKTLEHYVITRIQELEKENDSLQERIRNLQAELEQQTALSNIQTQMHEEFVNIISGICKIKKSSFDSEDRYISFDSVYERWDKEKFVRVLAYLNLDEVKEESGDE